MNQKKEFFLCYPCLQGKNEKNAFGTYFNLVAHVKKKHKTVYVDIKKHYEEKPVKSMAVYCDLKNCIRKSFKKESGYQCFNNCPIYSTQYLEKYHTENLGPFKCGKSDCYYNGLHEKQWSANRCKGNNHSQDADNSKSSNSQGQTNNDDFQVAVKSPPSNNELHSSVDHVRLEEVMERMSRVSGWEDCTFLLESVKILLREHKEMSQTVGAISNIVSHKRGVRTKEAKK